MRSRPPITVILPTYNAMPLLREAAASILAQTFHDFVLIIIDNRSTDDTPCFLESIADPRVIWITEDKRGGGAALQAGLRLVSSEFTAVMNADDIAGPTRLQHQYQYLRDHPNVVLVGSNMRFRIGDGLVSPTPLPATHTRIRRHLLHRSVAICHPSVMYRTLCARAIGGYRIEGAGQDLDFFLRMSEVGTVQNVSEALITYRLEPGSASASLPSDLQKAHAYAVECTRRRAAREPEPSLEEFAKQWQGRGRIAQFIEHARSASARCYRTSVSLRSREKGGRALLMLALAAMFNPCRALLNIERLAYSCVSAAGSRRGTSQV